MLTWLTSTIGQTITKWVSLIAVVVAVYWQIHKYGKAAERAKQIARDVAATKDRETVDDTAVRSELGKWLRND